jgi:hypothetical protein
MGQPLPPQEQIKKELDESDELIWDDGSGHYVEGCLDEWVIMSKVRARSIPVTTSGAYTCRVLRADGLGLLVVFSGRR